MSPCRRQPRIRRADHVGRWLAIAARVLPAVVLALVAAGPALAHGDAILPEPTPLTFVLDWTIDPLLQVGLLGAAALYLLAVWRIDRAHPANPVPRPPVAAFLAGIAVIEIALQSGIGTYDDTLFSVHMVQHMLLMFVAAPLLVLGAPITVLLRAVRPGARRDVVLPILHSRVVRVAGHPIVAWLLFTAVMYTSHLSPLFDLALENDLVHQVEHALFLGSAFLFWWPVVGLDPSPTRMAYPLRVLYMFLQFPLMSFLSLTIYSAPTALYSHYASLGRTWGPSPLADQQAAGAIMWVWGDIMFIVSIVLAVARWLRDDEARTARAEGRIDAERAAIREREVRLAARLASERGEPTDAG
jgi:putative membrane protein